MNLQGIIELVTSLFENVDVMELINMIMDVVGPIIGDLFK